jgi:anti-anti-sigma regulatory factor
MVNDAATFSISIHGAVIRATGVLDGLTVELLLAAAEFLFYRGNREVTVDLEATTSLDAIAAGALSRALDGQATGSHLHLLVPARLRSGGLVPA